MYVQQWEGKTGVVLALDGAENDGSCETWTLHVAASDSFYGRSVISSANLPKGCSNTDEVTQLLKRSTGTSADDGQGAWIELDTAGSLFQIRERSPQGMLLVRWKVALTQPTEPSMFPFVQLVAANMLRLQSAANEEKRRTTDQSVITENWKRTAMQLEGQWSKEKAVLLHNMQILLSGKHKHYTERIVDLERRLAVAEQEAADATKGSRKSSAAPPTPNAPDDVDQLDYDAETVRQLAAGERVKEEKKTPPKKKAPAKAKSSLLDKSKKKKPPPAKKPAATKTPTPAPEKSPVEQPIVYEESTKAPASDPASSGAEPMAVDEEIAPNLPQVKSRRRKWEADSSSDEDGGTTIAKSLTPAMPTAASSFRRGRSAVAPARRKVFDSSDDEDDGAVHRTSLRRAKSGAAQEHAGEAGQNGKATKEATEDDDDILEQLARVGSQKATDSGEMSDSSTEADILKQLETMRH